MTSHPRCAGRPASFNPRQPSPQVTAPGFCPRTGSQNEDGLHDEGMRFGNFMAPFHPVGQNPTLAIERDLDLIVAMDRLGFDEAWIGEHHSAGFEIIASPEVFIGVAAERTKHIKL